MTSLPMRRAIAAFSLTSAALLATALRAGTITAVQSGNWDDPATWGGTVPVPEDDIIVNGFTITRGSSAVVANATFGGGAVIDGLTSGTLEIAGDLHWGAMTFTSVGGLSLPGNTTLGGADLFAHQILTSEAFSFSHSQVTVISPTNQQYGLYDNGTGTAKWFAYGVFTLTGCSSISGSANSIFTIEHAGSTLNKTGAGNSYIAWSVENNGTVNVQEGTLEMYSSTLSGSGTYQVSPNATLYFNNSLLATNTTIAGNGTFVNVGSLRGPGTLIIDGHFAWTGGEVINLGGLRLTPNGTATLGAENYFGHQNFYNNATIITADNHGEVTVQAPSASQYGLYDGGYGNTRWNNKSGATFTLTGCASVLGSNNSIFTNEAGALLAHTGNGSSYVQWSFVNNGTVDVQAGLLQFYQTTLSGPGNYIIQANATLNFQDVSLATNTTVTGAGTFVNSGALTGPGTLVLDAHMDWTGGEILNPGGLRITPNGTATLGAENYFGHQYFYNNATIITADNHGQVTVLAPSASQYGLYDGGYGNTRWNNKSGATFTLTGCASVLGSNNSIFTNEAGALLAHTGNGSSYVQWSFVNNGTVDVQAGLLQFYQTTLSGPGNYTIQANATLNFLDVSLATNTTVTGAGTFVNSGALAGPGTLILDGHMNWTGGEILNPGGLRLTPNGTAMLGAENYFGHQYLYNNATVITADNHGEVAVLAPSASQYGLYDGGYGNTRWNNKSGATFTLTGCASVLGSNSSIFTNEAGATFAHAGNDLSYLQWSFVNNGHVDVQAGTMSFESGSYSGIGTVAVAANATLQFFNEQIADGTVVGGDGTVTLLTGVRVLGATQFNNVFNNGEVSGAGSVAVPGSLRWLGSFQNDGGLTLGTNGTFTLGAENYFDHQYFYSANTTVTADNYGQVTVQAPSVSQYGLYDGGYGNSRWNNKFDAAFALTGCASVLGSGTSVFINEPSADFAKTGAGTSLVQWTLDNRGALTVNGGILDLQGPVVQNDTANGTLTGGTWVVRANSTLLFPGAPNYTTMGANASVTLDGAGSVFAPVESVTQIHGALQITGGRQFSKAVNIGVFNGTLEVSGNGSLFATTGQVSVFGGLVKVADGASLTLGALDLGNGGASVASVGLGAGASTLSVAEVLVGSGAGGSATLNIHEGGTANLTGNLFLSVSAGVSSTVNLHSGGLLQVGGVDGIAQTHGNYTFNWNGGILKVGGSNLTSAINFNLGDALTGSGFDTNGLHATLSGNLTGDNYLIKLGAGNLTLTGNSSYAGTHVRQGALLVNGATAALAQSSPGEVIVGPSAGDDAALHIQNGAQVGSGIFVVGSDEGSLGQAVVTGSNSTLDIFGQLVVGVSGVGVLLVADGGQVTAGSMQLGHMSTAAGELVVQGAGSGVQISSDIYAGLLGVGNIGVYAGGSLQTGFLVLASHPSGNTTVTVNGANSTLTASATLAVAGSGVANVTVSGGGHATTNQTSIGAGPGSNGTVLVTGAASALTANETLIVGDAGVGSLTVSNGSMVSANNTILGNLTTGNGTVLVTGANSTLATTSALTVGLAGMGNFTVNNSALATAGETMLGDMAGGTGVVTVEGAGSALTTTTLLNIGYGGTGQFTVSGGGLATAANAALGALGTGNGTLTVTGADSTFTASGSLDVGENGMAAVAIHSGAHLSAANAVLGGAANGTGALTVSGANSTLTVSSLLYLGSNGTGSLTVNGGARATAGSTVLGYFGPGNGTLSVTGANSTFTTTSDLFVGLGGLGALTVANGGALSAPNVEIAYNNGANGTALVTGPNAMLTATGVLNIGRASSGNLTVSDGAKVSGNNTYLGLALGGNGTVTVTGANSTLTTSRTLIVGDTGAGALTISNGGLLTSNLTLIGSRVGSSGAVLVSGSGSRFAIANTLTISSSGTGALTVADGGRVSGNNSLVGLVAGSNGTVTVTGANSLFTTTQTLILGDAGRGGLTVSNGGTVAANNTILGNQTAGNGTVLVTGPNSTVTSSFSLKVGNTGAGSVTLADGGRLAVAPNITNNGENKAFLGYAAGGTGTVLITGANSTWTQSGSSEFYVGYDGAGSLTVANGGRLNSWATHVGTNPTGSGTVLVTGANSTWQVTGGFLKVGNTGQGSVTVSNGGTVISTDVDIGLFDGGHGAVTITGAGSTWSMETHALFVGHIGDASLTVENGGKLISGFSIIGNADTSTGTALVTGANSQWIISPDYLLTVGGSGQGSLTISNGGVLDSWTAHIGNALGGNGTALVTGANSAWTLRSGSLLGIGNRSAGGLTVSNGGRVEASSVTLGSLSSGNGTLNINGANSTVTVSGTVVVGQAGNGTVNIGAGGVLTSNGGTLGANGGSLGTLAMTGGSWNAGAANLSIGGLGVGLATVAGQLTGNIIKLGAGNTGNGAVVVSGNTALLQTSNALYVGESGLGNLTLALGANLATGGNAWIGFNANSTGTVHVGNATWTSNGSIIVGDSGTGTLTIDSGGVVSVTNSNPLLLATFGPAHATVNLQTGGLLKVRGADGILAGNGNYTFNWNGGTVQAVGANFSTAINAVLNPSATASQFDTNGFSATWSGNLSGENSFTKTGTGMLTLSGANTFIGLVTVLGGTLNLIGGGALADTVAVHLPAGGAGLQIGSSETVGMIEGVADAALTLGSGVIFTVGGTNANGTFAGGIAGAGALVKSGLGTLVLTGNNSYAGSTNISFGTIELTGPGARIHSPGAVVTVTGQSSLAKLVLADGAGLTSGNFRIGFGSGGNGTVVISGGNTTASTATVSMANGAAARGSLTVTDGATLFSTSAGLASTSASANATATVEMGGRWAISGNVFIGANGKGAMAVGASGNVTGNVISLGENALGDGSLQVVGNDAVFRSAGNLLVAVNGTGFLKVSDAATVSAGGDVWIGRATGSNGSVLVTNGGVLTMADSLVIGRSGTGTITIADGGEVIHTGGSALDRVMIGEFPSSTGVLNLNSGGILNLGGGNRLEAGSGDATFNWNGGTIRVTGNSFRTEMNVTLHPAATASTFDTNGFAATWAGVISGSGSFTKIGEGRLIIHSNNTLSGVVTIAAGTLQLGLVGASLGSAGIVNNGTLEFTGSQPVFDNLISGTGTVAKPVGNGLVFTADNTYTGGTVITLGTLQVGADGATGAIGSGDVSNSGTLQFQRSNAYTFGGSIAGPGDVAQNGTGAVHLNGNNTYTGATTVNAGTLVAVNGLNGTSSVTVESGAHLSLGGNSSASALILNGGLLSLNSTILVSSSYLNANFGVGNSFNARANVSGNGSINAAGDTAQAVLGPAISGGGTLTPVLTLPNLHEGGTVAASYAVANSGGTGPALAGAMQDAGITDPRLSGSGVTAQNWGPLAAGAATANFTVMLNGTTAGPLAANQSVALVNNFDNVADQVLAIQGGAVYRLAGATPQSGAVDLGIVHVGDTVIYNFAIANTAGATGGYTESLGVAVGSVGAGLGANGSISGLGPSDPASQNISVTLNTTVAGLLTGANVTLNYTSQGLSGSGLGNTALPSQTTTFNATINHFADPVFSMVSGDGNFTVVNPEEVLLDFGNVLAGTGPYVANLRLTNAALAPADWLAGNFTISDPSGQFSFGGFTAFDDLQSGQFVALIVTYLATASGDFNASVTLHAFSENFSGYSGNLGAFVLNVHGSVPEPSTYAAMAGALALAAALLRRRRRRRPDDLHPHNYE